MVKELHVLIGWRLGELEYLPWGWKTLPFAWRLMKGDCTQGMLVPGGGSEAPPWPAQVWRHGYVGIGIPATYLPNLQPMRSPFVPTAASPRNGDVCKPRM
jgi:hypothetical protein